MAGHTKLTTAALAVAQADWGDREARADLPVCLEVPKDAQGLWTSEDAKAQAAAKAFCLQCPRRRECVRMAIDSGATAGIFGAHNLGSSAGKREALIYLGDIEAKPRRRSPGRTRAAS